jgi:hypothetical protein
MGIEYGVDPLPGEHPAWGGMRFVCDHCGEPMLSRDGVLIELPIEHGGEAHERIRELTDEGSKPAPQHYHVHKVDCEWHFIHERGWTPEHYTSREITPDHE